eukprot:TRINITY_DN2946_c0_g1_i2.p1 TRINITY_DN2946_c0_g1~~TRINITY_DN2946_c0_g1_i2.p1  ORF type:complete len:407 (-),score=101.81 TRINITY_DN2946_c0_g1_i2:79-1299(-)
MFGGLTWGNMADRTGRRPALMLALTINGVFGVLSGFAWGVGSLLVCRFATGLGIGGSVPVVFTYFSEFLDNDHKGPWIVYLSISWMIGTIYAAAMAWATLDKALLPFAGTMIDSWRLYVSLCSIPAFSAAIMLLFFPESPQFYFSKQRTSEAFNSLRRVSTWNGKEVPLEFYAEDHVPGDVTVSSSEHDKFTWSFGFFGAVLSKFASVFKPPYAKVGSLSAAIWFTISLAYYGFTIWQPQYLKDRGLDPNDTAGLSLYMSTFIIALAQFPGSILSAYAVEWIDRGPTLTVSLFLSAISIFFILMVESSRDVVILTCVFSGISVASWNTLNVISTEMFDVEIRATAYGVSAAVGRIGSVVGNLAFGVFESTHPAIPIFLVCLFLFFGGLFSLALPKTRSRAIVSMHH